MVDFEDIELGESLDPRDRDRFLAVLAHRSSIIRDGFAYWQSKCPPEALPRRADIDPFDITPLMPHIVLIDVRREPRDFCYRVIGTTVVEHWTDDWTGVCMSEIGGQGPESKVWTSCDLVVTGRRPLLSRIPYVGPHADFLDIEDVILPLVDDDGAVEKLLVFIAFINKR